eukprot:jgi/Bigna1/79395/fgenesh1_pg.62_\
MNGSSLSKAGANHDDSGNASFLTSPPHDPRHKLSLSLPLPSADGFHARNLKICNNNDDDNKHDDNNIVSAVVNGHKSPIKTRHTENGNTDGNETKLRGLQKLKVSPALRDKYNSLASRAIPHTNKSNGPILRYWRTYCATTDLDDDDGDESPDADIEELPSPPPQRSGHKVDIAVPSSNWHHTISSAATTTRQRTSSGESGKNKSLKSGKKHNHRHHHRLNQSDVERPRRSLLVSRGGNGNNTPSVNKSVDRVKEIREQFRDRISKLQQEFVRQAEATATELEAVIHQSKQKCEERIQNHLNDLLKRIDHDEEDYLDNEDDDNKQEGAAEEEQHQPESLRLSQLQSPSPQRYVGPRRNMTADASSLSFQGFSSFSRRQQQQQQPRGGEQSRGPNPVNISSRRHHREDAHYYPRYRHRRPQYYHQRDGAVERPKEKDPEKRVVAAVAGTGIRGRRNSSGIENRSGARGGGGGEEDDEENQLKTMIRENRERRQRLINPAHLFSSSSSSASPSSSENDNNEEEEDYDIDGGKEKYSKRGAATNTTSTSDTYATNAAITGAAATTSNEEEREWVASSTQGTRRIATAANFAVSTGIGRRLLKEIELDLNEDLMVTTLPMANAAFAREWKDPPTAATAASDSAAAAAARATTVSSLSSVTSLKVVDGCTLSRSSSSSSTSSSRRRSSNGGGGDSSLAEKSRFLKRANKILFDSSSSSSSSIEDEDEKQLPSLEQASTDTAVSKALHLQEQPKQVISTAFRQRIVAMQQHHQQNE